MSYSTTGTGSWSTWSYYTWTSSHTSSSRTSPTEPSTDDAYWVPDYIYGIRGWSIDTFGMGQLIGKYAHWPTARMAASHTGADHTSPAWDCRCGVNAFKNPYEEGIDPAGQMKRIVQLKEFPVLGVVRMWGNIIEYEHGYRAQMAEMVELAAYETAEVDPSELMAKYGVPVLRSKWKTLPWWDENRKDGFIWPI